MDRNEREKFIREVLEDWDRDRTVERIADKWEEEIDSAYDEGVHAGYDGAQG